MNSLRVKGYATSIFPMDRNTRIGALELLPAGSSDN
jgi:hypothetical protein